VRTPLSCLACIAASVTLLCHDSAATELTFDIAGIGNSAVLPDEYGDRVTALTMGSFSYAESGEGFTPNVEVEYVRGPAQPAWWGPNYGDLQGVLYEERDGFGELEIVFRADPGFAVVLYSWDMAAYTPQSPSDPIINSVFVSNGIGCDRFRQDDAAISAATRTAFNFSSNPIAGRVIRLTFDSSNLGGASDNIGFDNIRFGQMTDFSCTADIAPLGAPDGQLNIDDVLLFLDGFSNESSFADLAAPCNTFNIDDVITFLDAFSAGCN
jgi:hypothetical protein